MFNPFARRRPEIEEAEPGAEPPMRAAALMGHFESLGDNCEFGLAQRGCGAEPLGLFRFSNAPMAPLLEALESRFVHYGSEGDIEIVAGANDELFCQSRRYWFAYHTGDLAATGKPAAILPREMRRIEYLKGRLLSDLAGGEKILVRKGPPGESGPEIEALFEAVRRLGPNALLWVVEADGAHPPGSVDVLRNGLLKGYVARFAPYEEATAVDLESWIEVCRNAYRLWRGLGEIRLARPGPNVLEPAAEALASLAGAGPDAPSREGFAVEAHRLRTGVDVVAHRALRGPARGGTTCVVSLWVWIPASFTGERVGVQYGPHRRAWREADLAQCESWQRIWASAKVPKNRTLADPTLVVAGGRDGDVLYAADWQLREGFTPDAS